MLEWIAGKLIELWQKCRKQKESDTAADNVAKQDADQLKKAKSQKEKEDAARNINNHTFSG